VQIMRGGFAIPLLAIGIAAPAGGWEYVVPGGEANAVLLAADEDVIAAGILGDPKVEARELSVVRLGRFDGAERWRYVVSSDGPLYQRGVHRQRAGRGARSC
jgi:hypothetical protein